MLRGLRLGSFVNFNDWRIRLGDGPGGLLLSGCCVGCAEIWSANVDQIKTKAKESDTIFLCDFSMFAVPRSYQLGQAQILDTNFEYELY